MPHCIIEYSDDIVNSVSVSTLLETVFNGALASDLFTEKDIKARALAYLDYYSGQDNLSFVHVTVKILSGRSTDQKSLLSHRILSNLEALSLSSVSLTVEVCDIDRECYAKTLK